MDVVSTAGLLKNLQNDDLIFAYAGSISDSITHKIIELTQSNIDSAGNFVKLKNKISFLMAECYQNVARHSKYSVSDESLNEHNSGFFVRSIGNTFHIASANVINNNLISSIKEKLDKVNSLTPEELKLLQKEVLSEGRLSDRGGAGLGIIEMARRTGQKICYSFEPINSENSLFFLQLTISIELEKSEVESANSLQQLKNLFFKMKKERLMVIHKGDFSESSILPIIHMIEKNILRLNEVKHGKQKLYNVSVELLQNISMHAERTGKINEALFTLKKINEHFIISTCNYISESSIVTLTNTLDHLKSLNINELNDLYREKLRLLIDEEASGIGIGLIYIFRKSLRLKYSITPSDDRHLLTLIVEV
jgi:hypothetical protein